MLNSKKAFPVHSHRTQGGAALISVILASLVLALMGSIAAQQAQISFLITHRIRENVEALVCADSGLSAALSEIHYEPRFERFESDRFPYSGQAPTMPLPPTFGLTTSLQPRSENRIDITTEARGRNRAYRSLSITIQRAKDPYVPAALYFHHTAPSILANNKISVRGANSGRYKIPAIAASSHSTATSIHDYFKAGGAKISGDPMALGWSNLDSALSKIRAHPRQMPLPEIINGPLPRAIGVSQSTVQINDAAAAGLWLIDGDLGIEGSFSFDGIIFVLGDVHLSPSSRTKIRGAVIQAMPGRALNARGQLEIRYDRKELLRALALFPDLLERRAEVIGWKDNS